MTMPPDTQVPPPQQEQSWGDALAVPLGIFGAMLGAIAGAVVVWLASKSGFYAVPLIGLGAGFGTTLLARRGSVVLAVVAALVAGIAGIVTEATLWPFIADNSFAYFVKNIHNMRAFSLLMHGVSVVLAGYIAWRK